ncbi:hypothetical protein N7456_001390 [Penicillium angulare]|uniref:Uncharacterized protein n=1 Tax=Penicillium angulare TaxID=116970 RepID=A0A9W9GE15_9EURO|nr:hypothetical protein N7456_001390 [Penicillium angulare]
MQSGRKYSYPEPLSESEKRHFSKYGKWPGRLVQVQKPKVLKATFCIFYVLTTLRKEHTSILVTLVRLGITKSRIKNPSKPTRLIPIAYLFHTLTVQFQLPLMSRRTKTGICVGTVQTLKEDPYFNIQAMKMKSRSNRKTDD